DGRLAAAGLTDDAEELARADLEADVLDHRFARIELERQVLDADCRLAVAGDHAGMLRAARGTYDLPSVRAIASPVRLTPIVTIAISAAGATTASALSEMYSRFSPIMRAQSELGGCRPSPRKLTDAMIKI